MSSNKKAALGRGLTALLQDINTDISEKNPIPVYAIAEISINHIEGNPFQPRQEFDDSALEELAASIRQHGIIQPITVRKTGYEQYEIISGERRTRAAIRVGLKTIPAYIRIANDQAMLEMALIENIHRENLNAIEIALSYQRLLEECRITQEDMALRVGKNRTTITNYLRLLKLPEEIQIALRDGQITMGHAKPLINVGKELQLQILNDIIAHDLNVRQVEERVKKQQQFSKPKKIVKNDRAQQWEDRWKEWTGIPVKIKMNTSGSGQIVIPFRSESELQKIVEGLEKNAE